MSDLEVALAMLQNVRSVTKSEEYARLYHMKERKSLAEILESKRDRTHDGQGHNVAIRCVYVEFADAPTLGLKTPTMLKEIAAWEGKIWRLPGHVRLGMDRCIERIQAEIDRRNAREMRKARVT